MRVLSCFGQPSIAGIGFLSGVHKDGEENAIKLTVRFFSGAHDNVDITLLKDTLE